MTTQKQFEDFLDRYCVPLSFDSLHSPGDDPRLPPPGPGGSGPGGAINPKDLADAVSKVKADVRNAAIERNLSHEETSSLMRLAVEQELVLKNIELAIRQQTFGQLEHGPIVLNSLRKPIREIATQPFQHPHFKKVELIQVRPERPLWDISGQERRILHRLGVKNQTYTVVHENTFYTQKLLDRLGGSVKVSKLSADLPDFKI